MQTILIDGKEFVLVPKEDLQPVIQVKETIQPETPGDILNDFLPAETTPSSSLPKPLEIATIEEATESVRIVDATSLINIPQAASKEYEYRKKFLTKTLTPHDVKTYRPNYALVKDFTEIPEIAALDSGNAPSQSTGPSFYGPGPQFDTVS